MKLNGVIHRSGEEPAVTSRDVTSASLGDVSRRVALGLLVSAPLAAIAAQHAAPAVVEDREQILADIRFLLDELKACDPPPASHILGIRRREDISFTVHFA